MNPTGTYLAIFLGDKESAKMEAWKALPEADRRTLEREGMFAWHSWAERNKAEIVTMGGPLGKTKKISTNGVEDFSNALGAFTVVRAASLEAAAKMFEITPTSRSFPVTALRSCRF
jgi:hypothetical protein